MMASTNHAIAERCQVRLHPIFRERFEDNQGVPPENRVEAAGQSGKLMSFYIQRKDRNWPIWRYHLINWNYRNILDVLTRGGTFS